MKKLVIVSVILAICVCLASVAFAADPAFTKQEADKLRLIVSERLPSEKVGGMTKEEIGDLTDQVTSGMTKDDIAGLSDEEIIEKVAKKVYSLATGVLSPNDNPLDPVDPDDPLNSLDGRGLGAVSPQTGIADRTPLVCCIAVAALAVLFGSVAYLKKAR